MNIPDTSDASAVDGINKCLGSWGHFYFFDEIFVKAYVIMSRRVVIAQIDTNLSGFFVKYFASREDQVWQATSPSELQVVLKRHDPDLLVVDRKIICLTSGKTHLPSCFGIVPTLKSYLPRMSLILKWTYLLDISQHYAVLKEPFDVAEMEQALHDLEEKSPVTARANTPSRIPKVRFPVRFKITLPYVFLALLVADSSSLCCEPGHPRYNRRALYKSANRNRKASQ